MQNRVDQTALRFNQFMIIVLLLLAFVVDWRWLVLFVAAVMLIGTVWPQAGLFKLLYVHVLKPVGLLKPAVVADEPQPHLFAQGVGAVVLLAAAGSFLLGWFSVGWTLTLLVVLLAAVNLFLGFCLGCFIYYQLALRGWQPRLSRWQPVESGVKNR